jgi:G3E family GTPase
VDSDSFATLGTDESRLAEAQVGLADLVVFNKTDLVDEDKLKGLEAKVREMAPTARFFRTVHGRVPIAALLSLDSLGGERSNRLKVAPSSFLSAPIPKADHLTFSKVDAGADLKPLFHASATHQHQHHEGCCEEHDHESHEKCCGEHHHEHEQQSLSDAFESFSMVIEKQLSLDKVRSALMELPLSIYRLKGLFFVDSNPEDQLLIQVVGPRISAAAAKPWADKPRSSEIVAIGLKGRVDQAELSALFESCIATQSDGFFKRLTERVQFWRR